MPTFPISSSAHSSCYFFVFSGGATRTSSFPTNTITIFNPPPPPPPHSSPNLINNNKQQLYLFNSSKTLTNFYPSTKLLFSVTSSNNSTSNSSNFDLPPAEEDDDDNNDGVDIEIEKIGNNSRRIRSRISIDATTLETVWGLLTDYEGLSDFIPGLSVSQLLEKGDNFARIFQIGQQNLAFGVNFNAKGIVDCYEKDLETLPFGRRRDIDFKMVEGDFETFQGKWSIEETYSSTDRPDVDQISGGGECHTTTTTTTVTLSYIVDVKPKLWLPVGLVEGRLCREVSLNLLCIREEAQKKVKHTLLPTC